MTKHLRIAIVGGLLAYAATTAGAVNAWIGEPSRSIVTFNTAVKIPGAQLRAGTYIFELASPETSREVVRVSSRDGKVHLTAFTRLVERPAALPANQIVMLGETPRDGAAPVTAWYPNPNGTGFEFIYR